MIAGWIRHASIVWPAYLCGWILLACRRRTELTGILRSPTLLVYRIPDRRRDQHWPAIELSDSLGGRVQPARHDNQHTSSLPLCKC